MKAIKEDPIAEILKKIAPGTPIREGLDNILKARTGALLLITDKQEVIDEIVDGGFNINEDYTSSKLYELAKMDGAIILSGDMKKILFSDIDVRKKRIVIRKLKRLWLDNKYIKIFINLLEYIQKI